MNLRTEWAQKCKLTTPDSFSRFPLIRLAYVGKTRLSLHRAGLVAGCNNLDKCR